MSDRTQGSVRTGSPAVDAAAPTDPGAPAGATPAAAAPAAAPPTATQSIPTTGSQRAQAPATGAQRKQGPATGGQRKQAPPAGGQAAQGPATGGAPAVDGSPATVRPQGGAATAPPVPPVPPTTGSTPAVPPSAGQTPAGGQSSAPEGSADAGQGVRGRGPARTGTGRGPRRARLQLRHIDTWSALKISLVLSIALFFIWMVAVGILYGVLNALGVFDTLNDLFGQIGSASGDESTGDVVTAGLIFGGAAVIGAINVVLMTALCTVGTFIYNLCSDLVGGLELTLSERD